jgi:nucleotide-binding universal stress UspA family protein
MYKRILVAIDGSQHSLIGGEIAVNLAKKTGAELLAANVYDAQIHTRRFHEMESILPGQFREEDTEEQLREVHNVWTNEGFLSLSKKRLSPYLAMCEQAGVTPIEVNRQGRNYVEILSAAEEAGADLLVMGAAGLGTVNDELGSTAARVLRKASCDVLLARKRPERGAIVVGIDGSEEAVAALKKATEWSTTLGHEIVMSAVYDPFFHTRVLQSLEDASSAYETSYHAQIYKAVDEHGNPQNYGRQTATAVEEAEHDSEGHDQMVDEGLARLYESFLEKAATVIDSGAKPSTKLLKGKPYQQLAEYAGQSDTDFLVVGRSGLHKTEDSALGSNAEGIARMSKTNVLIARD